MCRSSLKGNIKREFKLKRSAVKDMWQSVKSILQKGQQIHRWQGRWKLEISFHLFSSKSISSTSPDFKDTDGKAFDLSCPRFLA